MQRPSTINGTIRVSHDYDDDVVDDECDDTYDDDVD